LAKAATVLRFSSIALEAANHEGVVRQFLFSKSRAFSSRAALFDRDAFRQIARLVDVGALEHGHVVGQQLQRHGVEDRREQVVDVRHGHHMGALAVASPTAHREAETAKAHRG